MKVSYCLDSNTFIQANIQYYGLDFCPAYWDWLRKQNSEGVVFSIVNIRDELVKVDTILSVWVKNCNIRFFLEIDAETIDNYKLVVQWVDVNYKGEAEKTRFLGGADPWLIAFCMTHNHVLVSQEVMAADNSTKIKIPNVCKQFKVEYLNTFEMLRREKATFILS